MKKQQWKFQDAEKNGQYIGLIEFQSNDEEFHYFYIYETETAIVFGGACNCGFLESGYMPKDDYFSLDENLQELIQNLECFYNYGYQHTTLIVCNDRM